MVYLITGRAAIIALFYGNNQCTNRTAEVFNQQHLNNHVNRKYILQLVAKFQKTGTVGNKKRHSERN